MNLNKIIFIALSALTFAATDPLGYGYGRLRRGYSPFAQPQPQHAMMFSGFYGNPAYQGSMSAFAHKDMVATNSFSGEEYPPIQYHNQPAEPSGTETSNVDTFVEEELDLPPSTTVTPRKRKPTATTRIKSQVDVEEDSEDDGEQSWPFSRGGRGQVPSFNNFFPILFSGHGSSKTGGSDGYPSGSATAIANSFSTGKGGVASSHATAYGDPYFSMLARRKQNGSNRKQD